MIQLMTSTLTNQRFLLVSENLSYKNVLFMIADALGKQQPKVRINKLIGACVWRMEYLRSRITLSTPLLTKYTAKSAISNHPYTAEKIRNELNFEFEPIKSAIRKSRREYKFLDQLVILKRNYFFIFSLPFNTVFLSYCFPGFI